MACGCTVFVSCNINALEEINELGDYLAASSHFLEENYIQENLKTRKQTRLIQNQHYKNQRERKKVVKNIYKSKEFAFSFRIKFVACIE